MQESQTYSYIKNASIVITAEPDEGYMFHQLHVNNETYTDNPVSLTLTGSEYEVSADFVWTFPEKFTVVDYSTYYTGYYDEDGNPHFTGIEGYGTPYITLTGMVADAYEAKIKVTEPTGALGYTEDIIEVDKFWEADDYTLVTLDKSEHNISSEDTKLVICKQNVANGTYTVTLTSVDEPIRTKEITIYVEIPSE